MANRYVLSVTLPATTYLQVEADSVKDAIEAVTAHVDSLESLKEYSWEVEESAFPSVKYVSMEVVGATKKEEKQEDSNKPVPVVEGLDAVDDSGGLYSLIQVAESTEAEAPEYALVLYSPNSVEALEKTMDLSPYPVFMEDIVRIPVADVPDMKVLWLSGIPEDRMDVDPVCDPVSHEEPLGGDLNELLCLHSDISKSCNKVLEEYIFLKKDSGVFYVVAFFEPSEENRDTDACVETAIDVLWGVGDEQHTPNTEM